MNYLFRCEDDADPYKIQFFVAEKTINILDDCVDGLCSWKSFQEKFRNTVESCNIDFCGKSAASTYSSVFYMMMISVATLLFVNK